MKLQSLALVFLVVASTTPVRSGDSPALPSPWQHQDNGIFTVAGSTSAAGDVFPLKGTLDIWGMNDGCHFAGQLLRNGATIIAYVLPAELSGHATGGLVASSHQKEALCTVPFDHATVPQGAK